MKTRGILAVFAVFLTAFSFIWTRSGIPSSPAPQSGVAAAQPVVEDIIPPSVKSVTVPISQRTQHPRPSDDSQPLPTATPQPEPAIPFRLDFKVVKEWERKRDEFIVGMVDLAVEEWESWTPGQPPSHIGTKWPGKTWRWWPFVAAAVHHHEGDEANARKMLAVMWCESRGNPLAVNKSSKASGLMQHMPTWWSSRTKEAGWPEADVFDPVANIYVGAWLALRASYGGWQHWECA